MQHRRIHHVAFPPRRRNAMRNDYLKNALQVIDDPNILVNVISRRVKQLRRGSRPLVESLEKLALEDIALREVAEGKISYELVPIVENDVPDIGHLRNVRPSARVRHMTAKEVDE